MGTDDERDVLKFLMVNVVVLCFLSHGQNPLSLTISLDNFQDYHDLCLECVCGVFAICDCDEGLFFMIFSSQVEKWHIVLTGPLGLIDHWFSLLRLMVMFIPLPYVSQRVVFGCNFGTTTAMDGNFGNHDYCLYRLGSWSYRNAICSCVGKYLQVLLDVNALLGRVLVTFLGLNIFGLSFNLMITKHL